MRISRSSWLVERSMVVNRGDDEGVGSKRSTVKAGEHTYASWGTSTKLEGVYNKSDDKNFFFEDEEGDLDDQGQVDMIAYIRDTASRVYDSIFFYGLEMGSPERSQRTPKSK